MSAYICTMNIQQTSRAQPISPVKLIAGHPYFVFFLLFYVVAGITAGISTVHAQAGGEALNLFFSALPQGSYRVLPAIVHAAALNILLYCLSCLPRIWRPLIAVSGLSAAAKGFCMGASLTCMIGELGMRGLAWGVPLCILPAFLCIGALMLRMLADMRQREGAPDCGLTPRAMGLMALCILVEGAAAPVALKAWLQMI